MCGVVRLLRVFEENARLQARPVLLADPGEFEFGVFGHVSVNLIIAILPGATRGSFVEVVQVNRQWF